MSSYCKKCKNHRPECDTLGIAMSDEDDCEIEVTECSEYSTKTER